MLNFDEKNKKKDTRYEIFSKKTTPNFPKNLLLIVHDFSSHPVHIQSQAYGKVGNGAPFQLICFRNPQCAWSGAKDN